MTVRFVHSTANRPSAIAIIQLIGDSEPTLQQLTGVVDWPIRKLRLVNFADIDRGIAVRLTDSVTQLMPHGGPRVMQRLTDWLVELGATVIDHSASGTINPLDLYPEAEDHFEALMLLAMSRAASPQAIDLLLDQPRRWRHFHTAMQPLTTEDRQRSLRLNRLIDPPIVVLAGRPNVGKSTLSNALMGRAMSIAADAPGTTRDYTAGRIELAGLVVDWHDTPGIRSTDDPIERRAIELSQRLIERADLLIAMRDPNTDWPDLPRPPDLCVMNKCDLIGKPRLTEGKTGVGSELFISAVTGQGIPEFVAAVRNALIPPNDLHHQGPWLFDERLVIEPGPALRSGSA